MALDNKHKQQSLTIVMVRLMFFFNFEITAHTSVIQVPNKKNCQDQQEYEWSSSALNQDKN